MSDIAERIDDLIKSNSLKRIELCRAIGISESTVRGWMKGQCPSAEAAYKVARYFNVTVEWLVSGEDSSLKSIEPVFSEEEKELVGYFRTLSAKEKQSVMLMVRALGNDFESDRLNLKVADCDQLPFKKG